jgi:mannose-6-phosphate isomerase
MNKKQENPQAAPPNCKLQIANCKLQSSPRPLRFHPFLRPMVWGGRRLGDLLGKQLATPEPYGESWEVSDHPVFRSAVAGGPLAGRSLRALMEHDRAALLGPATGYEVFPWLIKFLDARDWLSVQVHPDQKAVATLWPGEGSKTEAWFILDAAPESRVYAGLLPGMDEARLRAALSAGTVAECLHSFQPQAGDCIFLPAGTVHAVGGGVLMAEVQQTSDATFRLFDWNRVDAQGKARTLHVEEALAAVHWDQGRVQPLRATGFEGLSAQPTSNERIQQTLVRCPYFILEYFQAGELFSCGGTGSLQAVIVLQGRGRLSPSEEEVSAGQVWVMPAALPQTWCRPEPVMSALLCYLPAPVTRN